MGEGELPTSACPSDGLALVDESFVLRVLRDVVDRHVRAVPVNSDCPEGETKSSGDAQSDTGELEGRMEAFWDLCADPDTSAFVVKHRGISVLQEAAERNNAEGRCAEIALGTLANIAAHRGLAQALLPGDAAALTSAVMLGIRSQDGLVVIQALRLMCCLLCGQAAGSHPELWSDQSVTYVLFVLENSLRWEALKQACDALSQGIVLEAKAEAEAEEQTAREPSAIRSAPCFSAAPLFAQHKLPRVLAIRISELAAAAAGETESNDEGDAEEVLLSALCLAESLAAMALTVAELAALGISALRALACAERPEVLSQALEVLAELGDADENEAAWAPTAAEASAAFRGRGEGGAESSSISSGLAERLEMLLSDSCSEAASKVAATLLQFAPQDEIAHHRRDRGSAP